MIKTERTRIHFLSEVLVAVASLDLKVPIVSMFCITSFGDYCTCPQNQETTNFWENAKKTFKLNPVLVVESTGVCDEGQCIIRNNGGRQSDYSENKRKNSCCCSDNCDMGGQRDSKMAVRRAWSVLARCWDDNREGQIFCQIHHSEN